LKNRVREDGLTCRKELNHEPAYLTTLEKWLANKNAVNETRMNDEWE
jgi:hypothetical protein